MKDIYLLLTKSDTFISKAIYLMTQDSYTHISISFEENLQPMYSCARKYLKWKVKFHFRYDKVDFSLSQASSWIYSYSWTYFYTSFVEFTLSPV